jgi:hypothetical protein
MVGLPQVKSKPYTFSVTANTICFYLLFIHHTMQMQVLACARIHQVRRPMHFL